MSGRPGCFNLGYSVGILSICYFVYITKYTMYILIIAIVYTALLLQVLSCVTVHNTVFWILHHNRIQQLSRQYVLGQLMLLTNYSKNKQVACLRCSIYDWTSIRSLYMRLRCLNYVLKFYKRIKNKSHRYISFVLDLRLFYPSVPVQLPRYFKYHTTKDCTEHRYDPL
jgi:hypothetical protein